jgi:hypothetical protein
MDVIPLNQSLTSLQFNVRELRLVQPEKTEVPTDDNPFPMLRVVRPLQPLKALLAMVDTSSPITTFFMDVISLNQSPVSLQFNDIVFRLVHNRNAEEPMEVILLGTSMEVSPLQPKKAPFPMLVTLLGIIIELNPLQYSNELFPIEVTLLGIVMEVKLVQQLNIQSSIFVIPSGMTNDVISLPSESIN